MACRHLLTGGRAVVSLVFAGSRLQKLFFTNEILGRECGNEVTAGQFFRAGWHWDICRVPGTEEEVYMWAH